MRLRTALFAIPALAVGISGLAEAQSRERDWDPQFRGLDRNSDNAISRREWRGSTQSFNEHDWNRDGFLSGDELMARSTGSADRNVDDSRYYNRDRYRDRAYFRDLDRNGDNVVSRSEWRATGREFRDLDVNQNGVLESDEIRSRSDSSNQGTRFSLRQRFTRIDQNGNGTIEGNEWKFNSDRFHALDTNRNSVLEFEEFANLRDDDSYFDRQ
jgi:hypothetical protein